MSDWLKGITKYSFKVQKVSEIKHEFLDENTKQFYKGLKRLIPVGDIYWVNLTDKKPKRTLAQNNFYWLYLNQLERETGDEAEVMHEYYKKTFLLSREAEYKGKIVEIPPSTASLTIKQFMEYIRNIEVDTGIPAPDPRLNGLAEYLSDFTYNSMV